MFHSLFYLNHPAIYTMCQNCPALISICSKVAFYSTVSNQCNCPPPLSPASGGNFPRFVLRQRGIFPSFCPAPAGESSFFPRWRPLAGVRGWKYLDLSILWKTYGGQTTKNVKCKIINVKLKMRMLNIEYSDKKTQILEKRH